MAENPQTQVGVEIELKKSEAKLRNAARMHDIHPTTLEDLILYVNEGVTAQPNPHLDAIMANNLTLATSFSDDGNTVTLRGFAMMMLSDDIPNDAWGSPEHVADWRSSRGKRGEMERGLPPGGPPGGGQP